MLVPLQQHKREQRILFRVYPMTGNVAAILPDVLVNQFNRTLRLGINRACRKFQEAPNVMLRQTRAATEDEYAALKELIESKFDTVLIVISENEL